MLLEYEDGNRAMTETEKESVRNCIETIASTPYGTAPYIRGMGVKEYPPGTESEIDRNKYASELMTQCDEWEDRVTVSEVKFYGKVAKVVIENV